MTRVCMGDSLARVEDAALLRGQAEFTDDISFNRQAYAYLVRSPYAHAQILNIDIHAARAAPGVLAVGTGADLEAQAMGVLYEPHQLSGGRSDGEFTNFPRLALATERVRHVGDAVAVVVADTLEQARDAAELVEVEYEELSPVVTPEQAFAADAPRIWPQAQGNVAARWEGGDSARTQAAFAKAARVVSLTLTNNRIVVAALEPRGAVGVFHPRDDHFTLYTGTQGVGPFRDNLATYGLGISSHRLRVITPDVGGGFGMKIPVYPEHVVVLWAARQTRRPVKWYAERGESFVCDGQGRDHVMRGELALDHQGRALAIRCHTTSNLGAYPNSAGVSIPTTGGTRCITGVYAIPTFFAQVTIAYTNTVPVVAYRGAGKPEFNYLIERLMDQAAYEMKMDPATLRRINVVAPQAMPFRTPMGLEFDSGDFGKNMDDALVLADRAGFSARRAQTQAAGRLRGFGFALFQEPDGYLHNSVHLRFDPNGNLTIGSSSQSNGQGHATMLAQIASHRFGLELDHIRLVQGDTDRVGHGEGTGGSRVTTSDSASFLKAADLLLDQAKDIAACQLEVSPEDLSFRDGEFVISGTDRSVTLKTVVACSFDPHRMGSDHDLGLEASAHHNASAYNYPSGCHVCEVELDPQTGVIELVHYSAVNDHGVVINPMLLEGQVHGGVAQGLGQALHECCVYDESSGQLLSGSFMDYCLPRASHIPNIAFERNVYPCTTNPLGVKGVGESGCTVAPAAVMHAVLDALRSIGVEQIDMPATPERVWRQCQRASREVRESGEV